ncbi:MAG: hypothetical protein QNJ57_13115 [Flavobacteriaceae bacterium]|nr:hypothetical protein [Flavobacteriaceae bacterium]
MKTKLLPTLIMAAVLVLTVFAFSTAVKEEKVVDKKIAMNFIKCTPAKFLLEELDSTKQISPLFDNLGNHRVEISTTDKMAQRFFDQGLSLTYAFNHAEAHRSFKEASRLDPNAAMTYWGQAYALGPNINDWMPDDERKKQAFEAAQKAQSLLSKTTPKEKALIEALQFRYSDDLSKDVTELNMNYMKAMTKVAQKFPQDDDVLTLYAAAIMNTTPWNYWNKDGNPSPYIAEAKTALEKAININPNNAGAHHYYIHMVELPNPDLAESSADKIGSLMPGAGHIVHMASHIYIRIGRYKDAVKVNQQAILADEEYISQCYSQGMYPLGYYPHNIHFLWSSASLLGASEIAIDAAKKTAEKVPVGELADMTFLQDFAATPLLAYTRFGKWNEILTVPKPKAEIKHLNIIWHYARGIAFIRKNNIKEAQEELEALAALKKDPALEDLVATAHNPSSRSVNIAYEVVAGELAALKGDLSKAIKHLKKAVVLEDQLTYTEPAAWHIPTRQNLGAILLKANKYAEAEAIYKEDLMVLRQNGWSLIGLYNSLELQGKSEEAKTIKKEFDKAWSDADIAIENSVL